MVKIKEEGIMGLVAKINIEDAIVKDAQTISNIHALSWKTAYKDIVPQKYLDELQSDFWTPHFINWIGKNNLKVKILYENSIPLGCIAYGKSRDESLPEWGEIVSVYIHPEHVNRGYGQRLLHTALIDMKKDEYPNCYLWVLEQNKNARYFYERNGFKCNQDKYNFEIMNKPLTDIRYTLDLKNYKQKN